MHQRFLVFTVLLLLSISLSSMDFNEENIINEASIATQDLQNQFDNVMNEVTSPINETIPLLNNEVPLEVKQSKSIEVNTIKNSTCKEENNCNDIEIQGSSIQGLIIFKTRIKPFCEMNGEQFAKQYMQEDWDDIYHDKEFKVEVLKACPKIEKRYKNKWTPHLYQFSLEYASDSDAIPEC